MIRSSNSASHQTSSPSDSRPHSMADVVPNFPSAASTQPSTIQIYARVRPARPNTRWHLTPDRYWCSADEQERARIGFRVPKDQAAGMVNNQREAYDFRFDRVFDMTAGQEEVFDTVAKPVVLRYPVTAGLLEPSETCTHH